MLNEITYQHLLTSERIGRISYHHHAQRYAIEHVDHFVLIVITEIYRFQRLLFLHQLSYIEWIWRRSFQT